jgi:hypothetical protein
MPLDPNISLSYQPPQIQNPLATMAQVQQLQNARLQQQTGQLELQQQQRTLAGQQALDDAMRSAVTMSPEGTPIFNRQAVSDSLSQGGFGHLVPGVLKSLTDTETAYADLAKKKADVAKVHQDLAEGTRDASGLLGVTVQKAGNTPGAAMGAIAYAKAHGLDPSVADDLAQRITANPTTDTVKQLTDNLIAQSPKAQAILKGQQEAAAATETAETRRRAEDRQQQEFAIKAPGEQATAEFAQVRNLAPQLSGAVRSGTYAQAFQALPPNIQKYYPDPATNPKDLDVLRAGMSPAEVQTGAHQTVEEQQGAQRIAIERQAQEINKQRWGFEQGGGVSPAAQMIADGKVDPQTARTMLRNNPGLLGQVQTIAGQDFGFDKLDQRYGAIKGLAPGGTGQSHTAILALNTLVHHADLGIDAIDALNHGNFVPGNAAYDAIRNLGGNPAPNDFNIVKNFLSGEAAKVAQGGVPHEAEVKDAASALATKNSPDQLKGALNTLLQIAGGRMKPMIDEGKSAGLTARNSWDSTSPDFTVLQPDSKAVLTKRGIDPNTMKPVAQGGAPPVPATMPKNVTNHEYSQSRKQWRYSTDNGKTWQTLPAQ